MRGFLKSSITEWYKQIDNSDQKSTTIDLSNDFETIFIRNSFRNTFGEDISDTLIDWDFCENCIIRKGQMKLGKAVFTNMNNLI